MCVCGRLSPIVVIRSEPESIPLNFWSAVAAIWRFFSSIRLALVLLILIGIGSILGSFIPQAAQQSEDGLRLLGASRTLIWFVTSFELYDLFHSWWYSLLLEMLALNLLACSLSRVPSIVRALRKISGTPEQRLASSYRFLIPVHQRSAVEVALSNAKTGVRLHPPQNAGEYWYGESGRFCRSGFLFVHLGVVVILVAGGLSQVTRIEGWLSLAQGEQTAVVSMRSKTEGATTMQLPFEVRCKRFSIERYAASQDAIKEYVSELEIVSNGRVVYAQPIRVNTPLSFGGYSFYQSSYQNAPEQDRAHFRIEDAQGARVIDVKRGDPLARGEDGTEYRLQGLRENYGNLGAAARIESKRKDGQVRRFWVFARYPGFVKDNRPGEIGLDLIEINPGYATILQLSRDPGTAVLWIGCFFLLLGLLMAFAVHHRRVWCRLTEAGFEVIVWSHRGSEAFAHAVEEKLRSLPGVASQGKT
jgi:cytochrome c biogenesis protein